MNASPNADLQVWAIMMGLTLTLTLTLTLLLVPFIPGLRSIPRWSRVYRLIWRQHDTGPRSGGSGIESRAAPSPGPPVPESV